jgi:formylglycine-generating enzyme required for sulfatase activity
MPMPKIFISYRRADSRAHTGRIYDHLVAKFGKDNVFMDVDNIPPGADFPVYIQQWIDKAHVMLVVIGRQWLTVADEVGGRRLDDSGDFVRQEIEMGLNRGEALRVIPVLVDNALMPDEKDLPLSLKNLARLNATSVRDNRDFRRDMEWLISGIEKQHIVSTDYEILQPSGFDIYAAIEQFYSEFDGQHWGAAWITLDAIRASSGAEGIFDTETHAEDIRQAIDGEKCDKKYQTLPLIIRRGDLARTKSALESFQTMYPKYDPDQLIARELALMAQSSVPKLGSTRVTEILPEPFEWIPIPAHKVFLEGSTAPKVQTKYSIENFYIGKYPITNGQFQVFVDVDDGWRNSEWWSYSKGAYEWHVKQVSSLIYAFNVPSEHPRISISWFDAIAFCQWLSAKTGENITIPTEHQWLFAAQGDTGRIYPWGDFFDSDRCNFNTKTTTPVTRYSNGASIYEVMDISGNTWEWCIASMFEKIDPRTGNLMQAWRGGSCNEDDDSDLSVYHHRELTPGTTNEFCGFRIVCLLD